VKKNAEAPLTEVVDADIRRIDAVKGPANGTRFLMAKASGVGQAGIVPADMVRELAADPPAGDTYVGLEKASLDIPDGMTVEGLRSALQAALADAGLADKDGYVWVSDIVPGFVIFSGGEAGYRRVAWSVGASGAIEVSGPPEQVVNNAQWEPVTKAAKRKESAVSTATASADVRPAVAAGDAKAARAVLKAAARAKRDAKILKAARRVAKREVLGQARAVLGKGTLGSLGDAHQAVLDALKNESEKAGEGEEPSESVALLQALAGKIASLMTTQASQGGDPEPDGDEGMGDDAGDDGDGNPDEIEKASLRKARKAAAAARLAKRAARDELRAAKARRAIAKIGRRNSSADQAHVDAIDSHAAALGATYHQKPATGQSAIAKAAQPDTRVDDAINLVQQSVHLTDQLREALRGELAPMWEQLRKVAQTPLPGGPRVVMDRDGTLIPAGDGQPGVTFEQAAMRKAAEQFPIGSIEREALSKAAAQGAIKDLMQQGR